MTPLNTESAKPTSYDVAGFFSACPAHYKCAATVGWHGPGLCKCRTSPVCSTLSCTFNLQAISFRLCRSLCSENIACVCAGKQDSAKPPKSSLALGDARINPFITSYRTEYAAPFASGARIRSPLRNKMLADVADLKEIYSSAFQRVGE